MSKEKKFGTFMGVFVPNVTMMFGVILFMRLGLIVGNVALPQYLVMIAVSLVFMVITSLSIAMIVTNMQVGGGGAYFLISRSVGIEMGGALGIALILSQIISLAVCVSGFSYSFNFLLPDLPVRLIELTTLVVLTAISFTSANLALKMQFVIFCLLLTAIASVFLFTNPDKVMHLAAEATYFPEQLTFWQGFSLLYPAMTGIEAGMAMSGNLKNPSRSLWIGCLFALILVGATYALVGSYAWMLFPRHLLESSEMLLVRASDVPELIFAGIWGATLSSALGNLLGAPRMIQSLADDGVAPAILRKGYGTHNEPRYALGLTFFISGVLILFTTIDQILPIAAMICLLTYGTLNFAAGIAELIRSPSWRPSITIPWWLSLGAAALALFLMLMISILWTILTIVCVVLLYSLVRFSSIEVSFRDLRQNLIFFLSRFAIYQMSEKEENPHHWHPQLLAFSKSPPSDLQLLQFASCVASRSGILTVATILPEMWEDEGQVLAKKEAISNYLAKNGVNGLVEASPFEEPAAGIESLIKSYGIGQIQPNTVILNLASELNDWALVLHTIKTAKLYKKNVLLFHDVSGCKSQIFTEASYKRKKISIWWDTDYTGAFELMLSYVHSLTSGTLWRRSQCTLNFMAPDSKTKGHVKRYFQAFIKKSRVRMEPKIFVDSKGGKGYPHFDKYLKGYDIAFMPLRPIGDEEADEEYGAYLDGYFQALPKLLPVILATSYDALNHGEIY